jgi:hypothetical protein
MKNIKYVNKVFRLKKPMVVNLNGIPEPLTFKLGEEFHIVTDVLYMSGMLLPPPFQGPIINWIESNPNLFVDDTREF